MSKTLVAYFSASGTTAKLARNLSEAVNADLYEIRPAVAYTHADLNWMDRSSRSSVEMNDPTSRPALADADAPVANAERSFWAFRSGGMWPHPHQQLSGAV